MKRNPLPAVVICALIPLAASFGDPQSGRSAGSPQQLLRSLVGSWEGTCKTWFTPDTLSDESSIRGDFTAVQGGSYLRHTYRGTLRGKPYSGEYTIMYNPMEDIVQSAWYDSFHMNYALMFSEGKPQDHGFAVTGQYRVARGQTPWGWLTEFVLTDPDHLTITAYNIAPDGKEARAVESTLTRKQ